MSNKKRTSSNEVKAKSDVLNVNESVLDAISFFEGFKLNEDTLTTMDMSKDEIQSRENDEFYDSSLGELDFMDGEWKLRFHLGTGKFHMYWQLTNLASNKVYYYDPEKVSFVVRNATLVNHVNRGKHINKGRNKEVVAWVESDGVILTSPEKVKALDKQLKINYNPQTCVNWNRELLDGEEGNTTFEPFNADKMARKKELYKLGIDPETDEDFLRDFPMDWKNDPANARMSLDKETLPIIVTMGRQIYTYEGVEGDLLNEASKVNGQTLTNKVHKDNAKNSKDYTKDVEKKTKLKYDNAEDMHVTKYEYDDNAQAIHDELETLNGMEMIEYDSEPSKEFKDRAKNAIAGKSPHGSEPANSVKNDFAKDFEKRIKSSKKKRDDAKINYAAMGKDMELMSNGKSTSKSLAFENYNYFVVENNKIVKGYTLNEEQVQNLQETVAKVIIPELKSNNINIKEAKIHTKQGLGRIGLNENEGGDWSDAMGGRKEDRVMNEEIDSEYGDDTLFAFYQTKDENLSHLNGVLLGSWDFDLKGEYADYTRTELAQITYPDMEDWYPAEDLEHVVPGLKIKKANFKLKTRKEVEKQGLNVTPQNSMSYKLQEISKGGESQESENLKESIKVLKFKGKFFSVDHALKLIPESYKKDKNKFKMSDGDTKYLIEWNDSVLGGSATILETESPKLVAESMNKIKSLMSFNSLDKIASLNESNLRQEDDMVRIMATKNLEVMRESKEAERKKMLSENVKEKEVKGKFTPRKLALNEFTSKYTQLDRANFLKEGNSYEGVEYHVTIKESAIPSSELMKQIVDENATNIPAGRKIKFSFYDKDGNQIF